MTGDGSGKRATRHVLIIGAGIAGISAALRIRALDEMCSITLVDSAPRLGGKIAGATVNGCVVDGGADVLIGDKLRATTLFETLSLAQRVLRVNPGNLPTFERRNDKLEPSPTTFNGELLTFSGGIHELVDVATAALTNVAVLTSTTVESVKCSRDGTWITTFGDGRSLLSDAVIVAVPALSAKNLLAPIAPDAAAGLAAVEYPATTTVTMAWHGEDVPRRLEGTGYLVADPTAAVSACTWTSSKNPTHAPDGTILLRGYVRGVGRDAVSLVRAEVESALGITATPLFAQVYEWPAGIPVYSCDHETIVRAIEDGLRAAPGIFVAGSAFHGVGIPDCIRSGERAAESVAAYLAARQSEEAA